MDWLNSLRDEFALPKSTLYLDAAFASPMPNCVRKAMEDFCDYMQRGVVNKTHWFDVAEETRQLAADLIGGVNTRGITLTRNTVEGINIIAQSFPWEKANNIVLHDQEHPSNVLPYLNLQQRGVEVRIVRADNFRIPVDTIWERVDKNTRIVGISHVQFGTGFRCDLQELGRRCRQSNIFLVVDAIQSVGWIQCDAKNWGVDAVACGGHKGLMAPQGTGFLYCSDRLLEYLKPAYLGSSAVTKINKEGAWKVDILDKMDGRKFELSNLNFIGITGMNASLKLILKYRDKIEPHVMEMSARINRGLRELGYDVISSDRPEEQSTITSLQIAEPDKMKQYFADHEVIISRLDAGFIRFSVAHFTSPSEVADILALARMYKGR